MDPIRFTGKFLSPGKFEYRYFVYGWMREGIYLYIGMTTRGRNRFLQHHAVRRVRATDHADVWICKDGAECIKLEAELIKKHTPFLNRDLNPEYRGRSKSIEIAKPKVNRKVKAIKEVIKRFLQKQPPAEELVACTNKKERQALLEKYRTYA